MHKSDVYSCKFIAFNFSVIFYVELNNYYLFSISGARKIKEPIGCFVRFEQNEILKYVPIFLYKIEKKHINYYLTLRERVYEKNILRYFKETFYESKGKIKIIGRGWKIIRFSYQLFIKLGYTHNFFLFLSPILKDKFKKKKKKYYIFYSIFNNEVSLLLNKISLLRVPDVYTRKGIFYRKIIL
jgi:hypothetical protein